MEIFFVNHKLQRVLESDRELARRFGTRLGAVIGTRLNELRALPSLAAAVAVPHLRLHQLGGERDGQFALTLVEPYRLVLEIAQDPIPRLADGGVDLAAVTEVVVVEIVDYH